MANLFGNVLFNDLKNTILLHPDTEMQNLILSCIEICEYSQEVCNAIEADLDKAAQDAKRERLRRQELELAENHPFLDFCFPSEPKSEKEAPSKPQLRLEKGRNRALTPEAVLVFLQLRGYLGSVTDQTNYNRLKDSSVLSDYLDLRGLNLPSKACLCETLSKITKETFSLIHKVQLDIVFQDHLDDFSWCGIDSTSIHASTDWPTDSSMMHRLLERAYKVGSSLHKFGLADFASQRIWKGLQELRSLNFEINLCCGKPRSRKKVRRAYRKVITRTDKVASEILRQLETRRNKLNATSGISGLDRERLQHAFILIEEDVASALHVLTYAEDRVFNGISLPAAEKIFSLSDTTAAYIKKGNREPVIGYKPQICRSGEGFITAFDVQPGNPADSACLVPLVHQHVDMTRCIPEVVSADDGYPSKANFDALNSEDGLKIDTVSFSGSKGKKLLDSIDEALWKSENYTSARNDRSSVESIIFTMKFKFHAHSFRRRNINNVRSELYEKILAHNSWRLFELRKKNNIPSLLERESECFLPKAG